MTPSTALSPSPLLPPEFQLMPSRPLPPLPQRWFHSFEFPDGEQVEGIKPLASLREEADQIFSQPLAGRRVLDIGAWDGFFSFEAERRGAAEVLATDHFCWSGQGWGDKSGFDHAHARFGSQVRSLDLDVAQRTSRGCVAAGSRVPGRQGIGKCVHSVDRVGAGADFLRKVRDWVRRAAVARSGSGVPALGRNSGDVWALSAGQKNGPAVGPGRPVLPPMRAKGVSSPRAKGLGRGGWPRNRIGLGDCFS